MFLHPAPPFSWNLSQLLNLEEVKRGRIEKNLEEALFTFLVGDTGRSYGLFKCTFL